MDLRKKRYLSKAEKAGNMSEESFHKEIELIQGVISRMAQNSFLIKGWGISLVAIVLALTQEEIFQAQNGAVVLLLR